MRPRPHTSQSPDGSATMLAAMLRDRKPFIFARYGDGYLECVYQIRQGGTRDHEQYTPELREALRYSWEKLRWLGLSDSTRRLIIADWFSAKFNRRLDGLYPDQYADMVTGVVAAFANYEALMLDRRSSAVLDFYRAVKEDTRSKLVIGPQEWSPVVGMLDCTFLPIPASGLWDYLPGIRARLFDIKPEIVLHASGMAGTIPIVDYVQANPQATAINVGSSLDPLFRGKTRINQLEPRIARAFFVPLLGR